jgi:hypothetical protein
MQKSKLITLNAFDWYDGLVLGLARLAEAEAPSLASLLSWSQERRERAYAVVSLAPEQVVEVTLKAEGEWPAFVDFVRSLYAAAPTDVTVVVVDDDRNEVLKQSKVAVARVVNDVAADIEEALKPERRHWLD